MYADLGTKVLSEEEMSLVMGGQSFTDYIGCGASVIGLVGSFAGLFTPAGVLSATVFLPASAVGVGLSCGQLLSYF